MKTPTAKGSFLAVVALGAAILVGSSLPSQAQTAIQAQAPAQTVQASAPSLQGWQEPADGPQGQCDVGCCGG